MKLSIDGEIRRTEFVTSDSGFVNFIFLLILLQIVLTIVNVSLYQNDEALFVKVINCLIPFMSIIDYSCLKLKIITINEQPNIVYVIISMVYGIIVGILRYYFQKTTKSNVNVLFIVIDICLALISAFNMMMFILITLRINEICSIVTSNTFNHIEVVENKKVLLNKSISDNEALSNLFELEGEIHNLNKFLKFRIIVSALFYVYWIVIIIKLKLVSEVMDDMYYVTMIIIPYLFMLNNSVVLNGSIEKLESRFYVKTGLKHKILGIEVDSLFFLSVSYFMITVIVKFEL